MKYNFGLIGGDLRQTYLVKLLLEDDISDKINLYGVSGFDKENNDVRLCGCVEEVVRNSDVIIGAIPFTKDGVYVTGCNDNDGLRIDAFADKFLSVCPCRTVASSKYFFAGAVPGNVYAPLKEAGVNVFDITARDDFAVFNAVPTAEGAIQYIMAETPYTLAGRNVLVIGSGRVGRVVTHKFDRLNVNVTVSSRKPSERALWSAYGINSCGYGKDFREAVSKADIVVNTVPLPVVDDECLSVFKDEVLIIDLATGCDFFALSNEEKALKHKVIKLPGLPGKVAPLTAASYIKTVMVNILAENGG